jgi:hypothetical protein
MISTALTLAAAALMLQASDTTRASREAFTRCLGHFVETASRASKTLDQFNAEFPQACAAEQASFRQAIIARDSASRATRAGADDAANLEVEDARANFSDRFQMSLPVGQVAHAAPAPAAAGAAQPTVTAQTASATATPAPAGQPH